MESYNNSQKDNLEKTQTFLLKTSEQIDNFLREVDPKFWNANIPGINGTKLYEDLKEAADIMTNYARAIRGEVEPLKEVPQGYYSDSK